MKSNISVVAAAALLGACGFGGGDDLEELPPAPAAPQAEAPAAPGAGYGAPDGGPDTGQGPQGSSRLRPGEERYDRVGYAGYAGAGEGVFALSGVLPQGTHAEVTALDTGKTILVLIRGQGIGLIELSGGAARQLGVTGNAPRQRHRTGCDCARRRPARPDARRCAASTTRRSAPPLG